MRIALLLVLSLAPMGSAGSGESFTPAHRVSGIGVERDDISDELLAVRTELMIQSQTFSIMREPQALPGAKRITGSAKLQSLFKSAERSTGVPASLIEAIAYLESWGDARAESPAGPKGIMQISGATARAMGLRVLVSTRYKVTRERILLSPAKGKRKARYRTITHRTPYVVTSRDDRLVPERAIPAAARYFAGMEQRFGRDWAIFAYHCGQGCVAEMMDLTRRARGIPKDRMSVARMFFSNNPAWNRDLYEAIAQQMQRDWSPTYYFRIMRAQQLLALYRRDPQQFAQLAQEYRSDFTSAGIRAPHRLAVWLKRDDLIYRTSDDIRLDPGRRLVRALDRPEYLGYSLRVLADGPLTAENLSEASPAALGALAYIAFETRRMFDAMKPHDQKFQPLPVTALVEPEDFARTRREGLSHTSGQVFDIDYSGLPPAENEALRFVLNDLGWAGYLGFVEEDSSNLHIGPSPTSRDFFTSVFQESVGKKAAEEVTNQ